MSMIGNLLRVTEVELTSYLQDSSLFETRIYSDFDENNIDEAYVDLDKTWNVLAFLLGGKHKEYEDQKMAHLVFGRHTLDEDQDVGYGPARYLTIAEVQELNQALNQITDEEMRKRFSPEECEANDIYPSFWLEEDVNDLWDYISDHLQLLRKAYQTAADRKEAMITYLN